MVAVNPYQDLGIYGPDTVLAYKNKQREENPPHIYAISDLAFRNMLEEHENQSILVTGESGAGKTENTKKVIQYLAAITSSRSKSLLDQAAPANSTSSSGPNPTFEQKILQANPILEAFGNAQTVRNNNSSRFGKFIRIEFSRSGQIAGASIDWYLLEKSRVICQSPKERNYHIFYQLIKGAPKDLREALMLEPDLNYYAYLKDSNKIVDGVDDALEYKNLINSFRIMGFSAQEQNDFFRIMSAILNIGNIEIGSERSDQARILNVSQVERVCHLLGINAEFFIQGLLHPKVKAGREWIRQSRSASQVRNTLDALAKSLYEHTFGAIVDRINRTLDRNSDHTSFIGVLDIAGFEIFENNSFEQLCINYTNEKLQQFFNHHMFVLEQEEYNRENIAWKYIDFGHDLQPTIDLIERSNPIGIFSCLDEECVMPKATDASFTDKMNTYWTKRSPKYRPSRLSQGFILTHYAAEVEYTTEGWLEKNKDPLNDNITQLLIESSEVQVRKLFDESKNGNKTAGSTLIKKGIFRTVAQRHKEQLNHLMNELNSTHPHFIRCIIPNHTKTPHRLDNLLVLDQLRCNGVLEGIRIARTGYPNRLFFTEFRQRYEVLVTGMPKGYVEGQKACHLILSKLKLDENLYKVGLTKVFFKSGVLAELEERREQMTREIMVRFQSVARGTIQRQKIRKTLYKAQAISIIKKNFETYLEMKKNPWWKLYMQMGPLLLASQDSGNNKAQTLEIKKLEASVKKMEETNKSLADEQRERESELERIQGVLESERAIALDKEEILKRSQLREVDLETQLSGALEDLDRLEIQCEELLLAKKKVDSEVDAWRSELANGAHLIGLLEQDKSRLKEQIDLLETELEESSTDHQAQKAQMEKLTEELDYLRGKLAEREEEIKSLETQLQEQEEQLSLRAHSSEKSLVSANAQISQLTATAEEYRAQLDEQYKAAQEYENDIVKKERDFARLQTEFEKSKDLVNSLDADYKKLQGEHKAVLDKHNMVYHDLQQLQTQHAKLEADEREVRRLLQAKASDESKNDEGRRLLDLKVDELTIRLQEQQQSFSTEKQKLLGEITAKKNYIDKLLAEKETLAQTLSKLKGIQEANNKLAADLQQAQDKAQQASSAKSQLEFLKQQLVDKEAETEKLGHQNSDLSTRLSESGANATRLHSDIKTLQAEKSQLVQQITQLKQFIEEDLSNKENLILEKNKLTQDFEDAKQDLSTITFEYNKLKTELTKKKDNIRKIRSSFTDEATTQRTKLNKEKAILEAAEKKLKEELEAAKLEVVTLAKQKEKQAQEIEDLKHTVSQEQKVANAAQRNRDSLDEQVKQLKSTMDQQRRDHSQSEVTKRKLTASVDSLTKELKDKTEQLTTLQKVVVKHKSKDGTVDLIKQLEESDRRRKAAEDAKLVLEKQLSDAQKRMSETRSIPSFRKENVQPPSSPSTPVTPTGSISEHRSVRTTNGIRNAIDSIYQSFENNSSPQPQPLKRSGHFRNRSMQSFQKENLYSPNSSPLHSYNSNSTLHSGSIDLSVFESVKSLNIKTKSVEEIEELLASYESSKRDLLSVFQDTSKKLLDSKDQLARTENEKLRLIAELEKSNSGHDNNSQVEENEMLKSTVSDLEIRLDAESSKSQELADGLRLYKTRAEDYYSKLESAETVVLKATRAEAFARAQWKEADASLSTCLNENKKQEELNITLQSKVQQLEDQLEDSSIDFTHSVEAQKRLARELQDLKERRKQDTVDMEASLHTMRNRYKEEIKSLSEELEREKLATGELQTEYRHLQHEMEMQKVKNQFDTLDPSWKTFKAQLETKVKDLTKSNEEAVLAHQDSQKRIGSLLSQIRTMRATMEGIQANRDQLQNEKRVLEKRLDEVSQQVEELALSSHTPLRAAADSDDESVESLKQKMRMQGDAAQAAMDRLKNAESSLGDLKAQLETERERLEDTRAQKSSIDKENKQLHMKVVDLEAQLLGSKSHDTKFLNLKISELEKRLEEQSQQYAERSRTFRSNDRSVKDLMGQISQRDKAVQRMQEDLTRNETKIKGLQETVESLQSTETTHRLSARRAEREAKDAKEKSLRLQKDLEEWKSRYETLVANKRNSRLFV